MFDQALEGYNFGDAGRQIYEFLWDEYADWYIELSKTRMRVRSCEDTYTHIRKDSITHICLCAHIHILVYLYTHTYIQTCRGNPL